MKKKNFCLKMGRLLAITIIAISFAGCRPLRTVTEQVPVYIRDTLYQSQRENEREKDSVIIERTVTVQAADSAVLEELASMGLKLEGGREVVLVLQRELERRISELETMRSDSSCQRNETPVPVTNTEYVEVERPLSWLQRTLIYTGIAALGLAVLWGVLRVIRGRKGNI